MPQQIPGGIGDFDGNCLLEFDETVPLEGIDVHHTDHHDPPLLTYANDFPAKFFAQPRLSSTPGGDDMDVSAETDAPRALLNLYDEALPVVYGYFVRRCGDRGTAEDLTSETFLAAMDAARKPSPPPMSVPWLIGVARHKLADHYRRRRDRFTVPVAELPEPVDPIDDWDTELDRIVAEAVLARLPEHHRTVLALRYLDDRSVGECAELIGRTVHATEALLVRARRAFRSEYPTPEGGTP